MEIVLPHFVISVDEKIFEDVFREIYPAVPPPKLVCDTYAPSDEEMRKKKKIILATHFSDTNTVVFYPFHWNKSDVKNIQSTRKFFLHVLAHELSHCQLVYNPTSPLGQAYAKKSRLMLTICAPFKNYVRIVTTGLVMGLASLLIACKIVTGFWFPLWQTTLLSTSLFNLVFLPTTAAIIFLVMINIFTWLAYKIFQLAQGQREEIVERAAEALMFKDGALLNSIVMIRQDSQKWLEMCLAAALNK